MIPAADIRWLSHTLGLLYAADTVPDLARSVMNAIDRRFNLLASACEEIGRGGSTYVAHGMRTSVAPPENHAAYFHDHPFGHLVGSDRSPPILHLRESVAMDRWERTDHFQGIARPMGWNDQVLMVAQGTPTMVCVVLLRDTVFGAAENGLTHLLQPHLVACWRRVAATGAGSAGPEPLMLSAQLEALHLSHRQIAILQCYFPGWLPGRRLPGALRSWVVHFLREVRRQPPPYPLYAFAVEAARGRLLVRCFPSAPGLPVRLHLVETPATARVGSAALTPREHEVLDWIAQGKRDGEIATILGLSSKTVGKHIEHVLAKLRVGNRTAAAALGRRS